MDDERMAGGRGARHAREIEGHLSWLDSFTGAALAVLAVASGIYTYLGVSSLLDDTGALSVFAAMAYSVAVSVGIFVFWSYMMRLLPAMRTAASRLGLLASMALGSLAIVAMSSWLNAAALAGAAAVEQHLATHGAGVPGGAGTGEHDRGLGPGPVARRRPGPAELHRPRRAGGLGRAVGLRRPRRGVPAAAAEIRRARRRSRRRSRRQTPLVEAAFAEGNEILSRMRAPDCRAGAGRGALGHLLRRGGAAGQRHHPAAAAVGGAAGDPRRAGPGGLLGAADASTARRPTSAPASRRRSTACWRSSRSAPRRCASPPRASPEWSRRWRRSTRRSPPPTR